MHNIMVDCETLGVGKRCVLLDIALVRFDINTGELGEVLHVCIDRKTQQDAGRLTDQSTIDWWEKQSDDAKEIFNVIEQEGMSWSEAMNAVHHFICKVRNATLWSNGANFDIAILEEAYHMAGKRQPWQMWKTRCVRTLHDIVKELTGMKWKDNVPPPAVAHNSVEDCKYQIRYCVEAYAALNNAIVNGNKLMEAERG